LRHGRGDTSLQDLIGYSGFWRLLEALTHFLPALNLGQGQELRDLAGRHLGFLHQNLIRKSLHHVFHLKNVHRLTASSEGLVKTRCA
jgi:hypothetical protein